MCCDGCCHLFPRKAANNVFFWLLLQGGQASSIDECKADDSVLELSIRELLSTVGFDAEGAKELVKQWCQLVRAASDAGPYPELQQASNELAAKYNRAVKTLKAAARTADETIIATLGQERTDVEVYQVRQRALLVAAMAVAPCLAQLCRFASQFQLTGGLQQSAAVMSTDWCDALLCC
jgi:hypothetical protein